MKRTLLYGLLAASLSLGLLMQPVQAASASGRLVPVQVDGTVLGTVNHLEDGVTYVPLLNLLDASGGWSIYWDSQQQAAVATAKGYRLTADPDTDTVTVNGRTYPGTVFVERGRTYVPLRLVATACGGAVEWDPYLGGAAVTSANAEHDAVEL